MHTQESVYSHVTNMMVELFDIDRENIRPESDMADDLDIDSIDAVDMAIELQALTGRKIQPEQFKEIKTVQDLVDAVLNLLESEDNENKH